MSAASASSPPVSVVCALLLRGDQVLLARRPEGKRLSGLWEFPGGKVDAGETAEAALRRELREELDCEVDVQTQLPDAPFDYDWGGILLKPFVCVLRVDSPEPRALEHSALAWVRWEDLERYELAPADVPVVALYQANSSRSRPV